MKSTQRLNYVAELILESLSDIDDPDGYYIGRKTSLLRKMSKYECLGWAAFELDPGHWKRFATEFLAQHSIAGVRTPDDLKFVALAIGRL
jgi:hypothetical protein